MEKGNRKLGTVESMTERYSFGHKAISVALSVVLLGFGWPTTSLSRAYAADGSAATTQSATTGTTGSATGSDTAASSGAAGTAASDSAATASDEGTSGVQVVASDSETASTGAAIDQTSTSAAAAEEADVEFVLNNAYATYMGQNIAAPAHKVTAPTNQKFEFSVTPENGYKLVKVTVAVGSAEATEIAADNDGIYSIEAADVAAGVTVTLETEKEAAASTTEEATPIEQTDTKANTKSDESKSDTEKATTSDDSKSTSASDADKSNASASDKSNSDTAASTAEKVEETKAASEQTEKKSKAYSALSNLLSNLSLSAATTSLTADGYGVNAISTASELGTDTDTEKWIYVGDTTTFSGTSGYNHSWTSSSSSTATVSGSENWGWFSSSSSTGTVTGVAKGDATITHTYYTMASTSSKYKKTETFTIHVVEESKDPATSVSISGADSVEAFSSTQLTATTSPSGSGGAATWTSSNEEILTVDSTGKVTGARQGTATVTVNVANSDGTTVSASKDIEVTATTTSSTEAQVYFLLDPTKDANSNDSGNWGPAYGVATVNTENATWIGGKNCFDNVDQRVVSWPNNTNVIDKSNSAWTTIFNNYKENIKAQLGVDISEDDVEEITLVPAKISRSNGGTYPTHLDCNVNIKMKGLSLVKYYLRDAGSAQWDLKGSKSYFDGNTTQPSDVTSESFPETKTSGDVKYTFSGWYLDQNLTQPVTFPYTVNSEQTFYAKYVGGFQVKYDLAGGTWNNSDSLMYTVEEGKTHTVKKEPTREGYKFTGWTVTGLDGTTTVTSGDSFTMPAGNVTITANWEALTAYNVKYLEQGTGTSLASSVTRYGEKGQQVSESAIVIDGYHIVGEATVTKTLGEGDNTITFYYAKDNANYTVNYYVNGTTTSIVDSDTKSAAWGSTISVSDVVKTIDGYTVVPDQSATITVDRDGNSSINVYYYINTTLTANSATAQYDGQSHTASGYTASHDGLTFSDIELPDTTQTEVGNYAHAFAKNDAGQATAIGKVDSTEQYIVTGTQDGSLQITSNTQAVTIKVSGNTASLKYNGAKQSVAGFTVDESTLPAGLAASEIVLKASASATAEGTNVKINEDGTIGSYAMGLTGDSFQLSSNKYSNVTFEVVSDGALTITKRQVTLTSEDGHKNYDGATIQRRTNVDVSGDGFVGTDDVLPKEKLTWYDENNILPGTYENKFDPAYTEGTNLDNYDVTLVFGTLTINERTKKYEITVTGNSASVTYDGDEHTATGITNESKTFTDSKSGTTFYIEADTSNPKSTNATTGMDNVVSNVKVYDAPAGTEGRHDVTSQFDPTTKDGKLVIAKRAVTLKSDSDTKVYDGDALTKDGVTVSGDGFVKDQYFSYEMTGSQTAVGTSENAFTYKLTGGATEGDSGNYVITPSYGTLTVTSRGATVDINIAANSGTVTYDGDSHSVSGIQNEKADADGTTYVEVTVGGKTYKVYGLTAEGATGTDVAVNQDGTVGSYVNNITGTPVVKDADGNDVTSEFNVVPVAGSLTINKRVVNIKSDDASRPYDGSPLTKATWSYADGTQDANKFVGDDEPILTFAETATITNVGTVSNAFEVAGIKGGKLSNYDVHTTAGTLAVTQSDAKVVVTIVGNSETAKYNGDSHSATGYEVKSISVTVNDEPVSTAYTTSDFSAPEQSAASVSATDVKGYDYNEDGTVKAVQSYAMGLAASQFANINANFKNENVTFQVTDGSLTINPRAATISSTTASKTYDGTPLVKNSIVNDIQVDGDGFVSGQGATYEFAAAATITNAGSVANSFGYTLTDATKAVNYSIAKTEGTLTVLPVTDAITVTITGKQGGKKYDGAAGSVSGYDVKIEGSSLYTSDKVAFSATASATAGGTDAATYTMGLAANQFSNVDTVNFTNVTFKVDKDGQYVISPRTVTLTSATPEAKEYDGNALTDSTVTVGEDGFVNGEGATYDVTGTQTLVGSSENTFSYSLYDGKTAGQTLTKAQNYNITTHFGTLQVKSRTSKYAVDVIANSSTDNTYDGGTHSATGIQDQKTATDGSKYIEVTVDGHKYTITGLSTTDPSKTDAGTYENNIIGTEVVTDENGNDVTAEFGLNKVNGSLKIAPKEVTITAASAVKEWDGTPLTTSEYTAEGFISGQGITSTTVTGSQTEVGSSDSAIADKSWVAAEGTNLANYNISTKTGTLQVKKVSGKVTVTIKGNTSTVKYNGTPQSVDGYSVESSNSLYQESYINFNGSKIVTQTDVKANAQTGATESYAMGLSSSQFSNTNSNFESVEFVVENDGSLTINPLEVSLVSESGSKAYDSTPLTKPDVTYAEGSDQFVNGEVSGLKATGSVVNAGDKQTNAIEYVKSANYKDTNYKVSKSEGELSITEADLDKDAVTWNVSDQTKVYDGSALKAGTATATDKYGNALTVEYSVDGKTWYTDPSNITLTHFGYTEVKLRATSSNYKSGQYAEDFEGVSITKRLVTLKSGSGTWPYDGNVHTNSDMTITPSGQGVGFVAGEGVDITWTGSITDAGTADNTFTYAAQKGTSLDDYLIKSEYGKLVVTEFADQVVVTITGKSGTATYDGTPHSVSGYDVKGITVGGEATTLYTSNDFKFTGEASHAVASGTAAGAYTMDLSSGDFANDNANFDGKVTFVVEPGALVISAQSIQGEDSPVEVGNLSDVVYNGKAQAQKPTVADTRGEGKTLVENTDYTVEFSQNVTDAGKVTVTVKGIGNYTGTVTREYNITARPVDLYSGSKSWTYDGDSHSFAGVTGAEQNDQLGTGFITGEVTNVEATGSVTTVADNKDGNNAIDFTPSAGYKATNYNVSKHPGTLTINPVQETVTVQITENSGTATYDGSMHSVSGYNVTNISNSLYSSGYFAFTGEASHAVASGTAVGTYPMGLVATDFTNNNANFANVEFSIVDGSLIIAGQSVNPKKDDGSDDPDYKGLTITYPGNVVYNGQSQAQKPTVTDKNGNELVEGRDYTVSFSEDTTNAGTVIVTVTGIGNYKGAASGTYDITARSVSLKSEGGSKPYDGTPLTKPAVSTTSTLGFIDGDVSNLRATGSVTNVGDGQVDNTIEWDWANDTVKNNYTVSKDEGKLSITAKSITDSSMNVGTLSNVTYNGKSQAQKPSVLDGTTPLVEGRDYTVTFSEDTKNAGTVTVTIKGIGNYSGTVTREYAIEKATLTVKTESASRAYNGEALTAGGTISGFVVVDGVAETANLVMTGSQTIVGSSTNTYSIDWTGTASKDNYTISEELGKLTVTESENEIVVTVTGFDGTYDGLPHAATVKVDNLPDGYRAEASSNATATDANGDGITATADTLAIYNTDNVDVTKDLSITIVPGTIKIAPKALTVTTDSAEKVYDGNALTAKGSISGFVEVDGVAESAPFTVTGTQTDVGSSANKYSIGWDSKDATAKKGNYTVSETLGTLTVTAQTIDPTPGEDGKPSPAYDGVLVSDPEDVEYNGASQQQAVTVTDKNGNPLSFDDYDIEYSSDTTNAGTVTVTIKGKGNYTGTVTRTYNITKAKLTVTTDSDTKVYDGEALTAGGSITGMKNGETASVETSKSQTEVGSTANDEYKVVWGTAKESNYEVVAGQMGTLTVTAQSITPGPDPENPDPSYSGVKIDDPDEVVYDGDIHKWTPTVTDKDGKPLTEGKDYDVTYNTDDFTNVNGTITVTITGKGDYSGTVVKEYGITPATATVTTGSAEKVYDGQPLTAGGSIALVGGDVATVSTSASITKVGSVANDAYSIDWGTAKASNYNVVEGDMGTLTVTAQSISPKKDDGSDDPAYKGVEVDQPDSPTYDGDSHKWTPTVTDKDGKVLEEGKDYDVTYTDADGNEVTDFTNVTGEIIVTITGKGDYSGTISYTYQINPRGYTVTTQSATKVYDGQPLTATGSTNGFVNAEDAVLTTTGSQTEVGSSSNTYELAWASDQMRANYTLTSESLGTLTVTDAATPAPTPTPTPNTTPTTPTTPATPVTPATTNVTTPSIPVLDNIAQVLEDGYEAVTGTQEEQIADDENPLATVHSKNCFVHFYIMLVALLTAIYGAGVMVRRNSYARRLAEEMNGILDGDDKKKE